MLKWSEVLESDSFQEWEADQLRHLPWEDPDMNDRVNAAAAHGGEGRTHREIIKGWREYVGECLAGRDGLPAEITDSLMDEIDACEKWHEEAGDIDIEVG